MKYTAADMEALHAALYKACDLEALPFNVIHQRKWSDFLFEIQELTHSEGGNLKPVDVAAVVGYRRRENARGKRNYALKPSSIMSNAGGFLDDVLLMRKQLKKVAYKPAITPVQAAGPTIAETTDEEIAEGVKLFQHLRKTL